jgi:hypothetical protein
MIAAAEYEVTKNCFMQLDYRLLNADYERGTGSRRFVYDVTMCGPYMAFGLKF